MDANDQNADAGLPRRRFIAGVAALGAGTLVEGCAMTAPAPSALERNKAVALRFKKLQGTKDEHLIEKEVLAPGYQRHRGGLLHLASNARDQGWPSSGSYLRAAFPDREDVILEVIAEGDQVGLLFRLMGTHTGNLFGIPPTGRKVDVAEVALLRVVDGRITEGWFMADEAGLLKQLGATLPPRKDGKLIVPQPTGTGEFGDDVMKRLLARKPVTREEINKLSVAATKTSAPPKDYRASDYRQARLGFQHMRDWGNANGVGKETPTTALPDRRDRVDGLIAEGDKVWMQFRIEGTHTGKLYGVAPTGKRLEAPEIGIVRIADGKWKEAWYCGDELGMMLQLNALHMLRA
jgi:predicted ester cyclase